MPRYDSGYDRQPRAGMQRGGYAGEYDRGWRGREPEIRVHRGERMDPRIRGGSAGWSGRREPGGYDRPFRGDTARGYDRMVRGGGGYDVGFRSESSFMRDLNDPYSGYFRVGGGISDLGRGRPRFFTDYGGNQGVRPGTDRGY